MSSLDFERKHAEDLQRLSALRLLDDDFMNKVFEDKACAEFLLQIILQRSDLKVAQVHVQHAIKICRDARHGWIFWRLTKKTACTTSKFSVTTEAQASSVADIIASLIDANITEPGEQYENLNETYVIFITEHDVLKGGRPIYCIERTVQETGESFGDGTHILYVNAQMKDDTALGQLMHDFACTSADEMHYQILADRVRYFKEDKEGVATMCKIMEDMKNEAAKRNSIETARVLLAMGKLSYEEIAQSGSTADSR